jgi:hypothetical protein
MAVDSLSAGEQWEGAGRPQSPFVLSRGPFRRSLGPPKVHFGGPRTCLIGGSCPSLMEGASRVAWTVVRLSSFACQAMQRVPPSRQAGVVTLAVLPWMLKYQYEGRRRSGTAARGPVPGLPGGLVSETRRSQRSVAPLACDPASQSDPQAIGWTLVDFGKHWLL